MRCRRKPFYPNIALGQGVVFFGALTVSAANYSDTSSVLFSRPLPSLLPNSPLPYPLAASKLPPRASPFGKSVVVAPKPQ